MTKEELNDFSVLFVSNLPSKTTESKLVEIFTVFGEVVRVTLQRKTKVLSAFVQFKTNVGVIQALKNEVTIGQHVLRIEKAKTQLTLYFSKLGDIEEDQLRTICEQFGEVDDVSLVYDLSTSKCKGNAFVKFLYHDDAISCYNYYHTKKTFVVDWAKSPIRKKSHFDKYTIFVGNILNDKEKVNNSTVRAIFKKYGKIEKLSSVIKNDKLFYFIKYDTTLSPTEALQGENSK